MPPEVMTRDERRLILVSALFLACGFLSLGLQQGNVFINGGHFFIWAICAWLGHWALKRWLPNRDTFLFPITIFLCGWGILTIDRLAPTFADRQTLWLIISMMALLGTAVLPQPLYWLRRYRYLLFLLGIVLLTSTIIFGENPTGDPLAPQLWLGFGPIYIQPAEVLKIILVAFLASYLGEHYPTMRSTHFIDARDFRHWLSPRIFGPMALMWGLSVSILIWQRDLGTAVLFFGVFIALLYVASGYRRILISGVLLTILAALAAYLFFDVVRLRIDIWLNPWPEADGRAYQIVQSLIAFSVGSVYGQGIGQGAPTYIPVVHSDFIFAAIAEEWGLVGVIISLLCFVILVGRGFKIALRQQGRPFYALLSIGLSALIGLQSFLIMGGVIKLVPLTGITLPFLSYGGSSLFVSCTIIGLLLRLSSGDY